MSKEDKTRAIMADSQMMSERIIKILEHYGWSCAELGRHIDCDASSVVRYKNYKRTTPMRKRMRINEIYNKISSLN